MSATLAPVRPRTADERFAEREYRVEGREKVSGRALYTGDIRMPGMLWAAFATSPYPHARIVSIDTRAAQEVPGVRAVLTGAQLGPLRFGRRLFDWPVLAYEKVRFIGEHVAAVAAETREAAEEAARLIEVEYEELPAALDCASALAADAPIIHEDAESYRFEPGTRLPREHPNIQGGRVLTKGESDLEPLFAQAYRVYEHRFRTPRQHHGFIEPRASVVWIDPQGVVHVQSPCKAPFRLRDQLAVVTGVPREKIVIETSYIGGDFGGKGLVIDEFACYFLARETGRPVKCVSDYVNELQATNVRHSAEITLRTGVDRDGTFLVHEARVDYDGGAYAAGKPGPHLTPGQLGFATIGYQVPHARLEVRVVYTNTVPGGHMRAPADVQTIFAWESHVDEIAKDLGIDPLELRLRNAMRDGDTALTGEPMHHPRAREVLETLRRESGWDRPRSKAPGRGRGIAFACRHTGGGKTSLVMRLSRDGKIDVLTGVPDQGSGSFTVVRRVAGATLSIDPERIAIRRGNTSEARNDPGAGASRVTHIVGQATHVAATELKGRLERESGMRLVEDRFVDEKSGRSEAFDTVASRLCASGPIEVVGAFDGSHSDPSHPADYSFSAFALEVEVDVETGALKILDVTFVVDVGTIINPVAHQGQIDGGFVYGIGGALMEELPLEGGKIVTLNLGEYKLPTIADIPPMRTVLLPPQRSGGPFGAKMAGELSNSGVAPAIANAVADAVGARVSEFPITSERIYAALRTPR
jgi:CO/xanthine dehydrogenase Mo-binding subunit